MKKNILLIAFIAISFAFKAPSSSYWQQRVNYNIDVELDDVNHILRGYEEFEYTNNSPDTLNYIFIHVWPNAYKHDHTPFAKQQVENGDTKFYYADESDRGFIDSLKFEVNELPVNSNTYNNQDDIKLLELVEPLLPGKTIKVSTPFRVVIPKNFSRLGHEGQTYQITQWYPKPAVYDKDGWHAMSYLDQGEFYSEYGNFDVKITLPQDYVVAATGDLKTESEIDFIEKRINVADFNANTFRNGVKTIRYTQQNVHDFAWFADKSFLVSKEEFKLPSGKKCTAYAYYTPANAKKYDEAAKVLAETAIYLSEHVGEYPYNQISIVDGPLYAGGGMEYPNIAILGRMPNRNTLNAVIIHEAGHNWFQGLLGSNEREHPWLDEGVNSFYENKIEEYLEEKGFDVSVNDGNDIVYHLNGHARKEQPIELPSEEYTSMNYGGVVYARAARSLKYLEEYVGEDSWEQAMKAYYDEWHYKHPAPKDLRYFVEKFTNRDVRWYFEDYLYSSQPMDVKIKSVKTEGKFTKVKVADKFEGDYPVHVFAMNDTVVVSQTWTENNEAVFRNLNQVTHYVVDQHKSTPDINTKNNTYKLGALFKHGAPKLALGTSLGTNTRGKSFLLPAVGFNNYDRTMLGLTLHNLTIPNQQFQYVLTPMYSFRTKALIGTGTMGYSFYPKNNFQKITLSVQGSSFHSDSNSLNTNDALYTRHYKLQPKIRLELPIKNLREKITRAIEASFFMTGRQDIDFNMDPTDSLDRPLASLYKVMNFARINYKHRNNRTFNPFDYSMQIEGNNDWLKWTAESNLRIDYFMKDKALYVRGFAGKFFYLNNTTNPLSLSPYYFNSAVTAENDYGYENYFVGRSEFSGWKSQQVMNREGGFVTRTTKLTSPLGRSDDWLVAVNLRSDLPIKFPILPQVFFNAASYGGAAQSNPSGAKLLFEAGVHLNFYKDIIRISLPLLLSKDLKDYTKSVYTQNRIPQQISFSINTQNLDFLRSQDLVDLFVQ